MTGTDLSDEPRYDWEYRAVCSDEGSDHILLQSDATNTVHEAREALPLDHCPGCGAPLDIEIDQQRTDVIDA